MSIMQEVLAYEDFMIRERRHFHVNAEPSAREFKTMEHIDALLTEFGIPHVVIEDGGILGYINGSKEGRTVLLRADCDALPMDEAKNNLKGPKVCVSANKGVCHACGHDGHMASLLTAARVLNDHKEELEGRVLIMFERGEEGTHNVIAIHRWMEDHDIKVDTCYGSHIYNALPTGTIAINDGPVMSGSAGFDFTITGRGGHGSRPDLSVSPVDCFVAIYNGMNALRMRNVSPFQPLTFSVGTLHSGTASNIIPDDLRFTGTIRVFDIKSGKAYMEQLKQMVEETCKAYNCTYTINKLQGPFSPVLNDKECAAFARGEVEAAVKEEGGKVVTCEPWMASESFALTQNKWPGVFALVGMQNAEVGSGAAHHNGAFDIDEAALKYAAAAYVAYAIGYLADGPDTSEKVFKGTFAEIYEQNSSKPAELAYLRHETDVPPCRV